MKNPFQLHCFQWPCAFPKQAVNCDHVQLETEAGTALISAAESQSPTGCGVWCSTC